MLHSIRIHGRIQIRYIRALSSSYAAYGYDPEINPEPVGKESMHLHQINVRWNEFDKKWLAPQLAEVQTSFEENGFAVVRGLIPKESMSTYKSMHNNLVNNQNLLVPGRHDLGSHKERTTKESENVGQIMWPSDIFKHGREGPVHSRGYEIARLLVGIDAAFDFDMLIWKNARTITETPWHQDEAYWPKGMTDKRTLTVWCALDEATIDNGAMWFIKGSHSHENGLRPHSSAGEGSHVLKTTDDIDENTKGAVCVPLNAGDAVIWGGRTLHYSRGNSTDKKRRTFIANFRPREMVKYQRENGFDHMRAFGYAGEAERKRKLAESTL
eukprot:GSMAST32.ASY1.ANO1.1674.1 assembled CDS